MKRSILMISMAAAAILATASLGASPKQEAPTTPAFGPGYGGGMMGGGMGRGFGRTDTPDNVGPGMMQGGRGGRGQMSPQNRGFGWQGQAETLLDEPLTLDGAAERVEAAIQEWGYTDLEVAEVIQYQLNFYVLVKEKDTDKGATELLVDARTGLVRFEQGPAMMWNTKYGHMRFSTGTAGTKISADEAKTIAADWLKQNGDTTAWTMELTEMYGYYSIHLEREGRVEAMLSVNAATKEVWYHGWHGAYVASKEIAG